MSALLGVVVVVAAYGVPYAARARTLRARGRPVPAWRIACFCAALGAFALALSPPIGGIDERSLPAHMLEHLLLGDLAPLLLVLGCTAAVVAPLLRTPLGRLRGLAHPAVALPVWLVTFGVWHMPFAYDAAVRSEAVHLVQHACFVAAGVILWTPLLGSLPRPGWFGGGARIGYLIGYWLFGGLVGSALAFSTQPIYGAYAHLPHAVDHQNTAGALMLVEQGIVATCLLCWLFLALFAQMEERQQIVDLAARRGLMLDPRRVARAVAAGNGDLLRRRILADRSEQAHPPETPAAPAGIIGTDVRDVG